MRGWLRAPPSLWMPAIVRRRWKAALSAESVRSVPSRFENSELLSKQCDERGDYGVEAGAQRNDTCFKELRPANVNEGLRQVDICDLETSRFATTECSAVQEQQERAQRVRVDVGIRPSRRWNRRENPLQLGF